MRLSSTPFGPIAMTGSVAPSALPPAEAEALHRARKQVKRLRDFYVLCGTALLVVGLTAVVNLVTDPDRLWFLWVVFGFAIAIGFSALDVFARDRLLGAAWEERKLREIIERRRA
jgi:Na+/melibiose symporter-like transporter